MFCSTKTKHLLANRNVEIVNKEKEEERGNKEEVLKKRKRRKKEKRVPHLFFLRTSSYS
jgi:hypothetical protein